MHGPGNSSGECKVLGDFDYKYAKSRSTKYHGENLTNINKIKRQQENNAIVNSAMYEILLEEKQKLSAKKGSYENIESDIDGNELYQIDNISLEDTKVKLELRKA